MDSMKAMHPAVVPSENASFSMPANASVTYIDNSMHVIEPVNYDESDIPFGSSKFRCAPFLHFQQSSNSSVT